MADEWTNRGYSTTILEKAESTINKAIDKNLIFTQDLPYWMKDVDLYSSIASSHRTALLVKDYDWYSQFDWPEDLGARPDNYDYIWFE